jgi:hypothetical protein
MAKRGTVNHPKTKDLARLLEISRSHAVGLQETMWHMTAELTKDGGIGKYPDKEIAEQLFWPGDPKALVDALIEAKLLDQMPLCRLYVHDWHEHCDDFVDMALARKHLVYANGAIPRMTRLNKDKKAELEPILKAASRALCAQIKAAPAESVRTAMPSHASPSHAMPKDQVRTPDRAHKPKPAAKAEAASLDIEIPETPAEHVQVILCEVPNFAIRPPSIQSIQEIINDFPQLESDTIIRAARSARDWAKTADRYAKDTRKAGAGNTFFRQWLTRGLQDMLKEQAQLANLRSAASNGKKKPVEGEDYVWTTLGGEPTMVEPGTKTPFNEQAWYDQRGLKKS